MTFEEIETEVTRFVEDVQNNRSRKLMIERAMKVQSMLREFNKFIIVWSLADFEKRAFELEIEEIDEMAARALKNEDYDEHNRLDLILDELRECGGEEPMPEEFRLFDRSLFESALKEMIDDHESNDGISWETVGAYLTSMCDKRVLKNAA